jgi:hypothetical protein
MQIAIILEQAKKVSGIFAAPKAKASAPAS